MPARARHWVPAVLLAALAGSSCGPGGKKGAPIDAGNALPLPVSDCIDNDGDGAPGTGDCQGFANRDCNDNDPMVKPGGVEVCDGLDNDCNGMTDDGLATAPYYKDEDGDGVGGTVKVGEGCGAPPLGAVKTTGDCKDSDPSIHPGALELCNKIDDNCDGQVDNGTSFQSYYPDVDGDGFGASSAAAETSCAPVPGKVTNNTDCNDGAPTVKPNAPETCNGVDDNCNGLVDDGLTRTVYFTDNDSDGFGAGAGTSACAPIPGKVTNSGDCNDANPSVKPGAPELCNGIDDNCNSQIDEGLTFLHYYPDADSDGFGSKTAAAVIACAPIAGKVANNTDCNDAQFSIHPGAAEACNAIDDNCDGLIDNGTVSQSYYPDGDGDGYGAVGGASIISCTPIAGRAPNNTDCNDSNAAIHPGAAELCNGIDDNCVAGVDEGNPGGGVSCTTGRSGVCSAGTRVCTAGVLTCVPNTAPSPEKCNGLDDNCNGSIDETFPTKGQACTAGLGVCLRSGTNVCSADQLSVVCGAVAGPRTAPACDGLDNDCDGAIDEPGFASTDDVSATAWTDVEVKPYYNSPASCAGGIAGAGGTDALAGGAMVMAGGTGGIFLQRLTTTGAPVGAPVSATGYEYTDVDLAQVADGFLVAGIWKSSSGAGYEIDLYYLNASTGALRTQLGSQFRRDPAYPNNSLDSLRLVRGNGRRVVMLWRETGLGPNIGIKMVTLQACVSGSGWAITGPQCGAVPTPTLFPGTANSPAGIGADSSHEDWVATQTCQTPITPRKLGVAWLTAPTALTFFTINEDGTSKSAETVVRTATAPESLDQPEVTFFRGGSPVDDHFFVANVFHDPSVTPGATDLQYWLTTAPSYHYAYLRFATNNGAASIFRPRASNTASQIWVSALRYDLDQTGTSFHRQVMTRQMDLLGNKLPPSSSVELSPTTGSCVGQPTACRPGNKEGFTQWAAFGRTYYSATAATPTGTFSSVLTCN